MRVPVVTVLLVSVSAFVSAQSLGEASRRESKRRTTSTGTGKSYSDADLPARPLEPRTEAPEATPSPSPKGEAATKPAEKPTPDEILRIQLDNEEARRKAQEQDWRARCRQALQNIERAQREYDAACGAPLQLSGG